MKKKKKNHLSLDQFGTAIGLSHWEKELVRQKNKAIEILKSARVKKKISQALLAEKLGTHQPAIARMESGQVGDISFDFLVRVALVLGVSLEISPLKRAA
ncbi:MAG: helix-turn-helix transcriptional regulator [Deltaproteobacteria bacterium]|nr:MAG: helix-turn-helix transcriptional regulator [Deltaproteobacteria bacterium]